MTSARADSILNYWQAIEYLIPAEAPKLDDKRCWTCHRDAELPWFDKRRLALLKPPSKSKVRIEFAVYIGLLEMDRLAKRVSELLRVDAPDYERDRVSRPGAALALQVDLDGVVTAPPVISSVPWAVSRIKDANSGGELNFDGFYGDEGFEGTTNRELNEVLKKRQLVRMQDPQDRAQPPDSKLGTHDDAEEREPVCQVRPSTVADFQALLARALMLTGCKDEFRTTPGVRVRAIRVHPKREPEQLFLNSVFARELAVVRKAWSDAKVGDGLRRYVIGIDPAQRTDVMDVRGAREVIDATMPTHLPLGRWPASYPMALAQQFAVNMIRRELATKAGIFSVNGPPGTGKTTLLRDVIAMLVVERAKMMTKLGATGSAFELQPRGVRGEQPSDMYRLVNNELRGFGMVVACNTNKAAQNVTRELPTTKAIDAPGVTLDYFAAVAETVLAAKGEQFRRTGTAWGLIAAVLGKAELRSLFISRFWFAESSHPEGEPNADPALADFVNFRAVLSAAVPGAKPWREQCQQFTRALDRVTTEIDNRQKLAVEVRRVDQLMCAAHEAQAHYDHDHAALARTERALAAAQATLENARERHDISSRQLRGARTLNDALHELHEHVAHAPRLENTGTPSTWTTGAIAACIEDLRAVSSLHARTVSDIEQRKPGGFARFFNTQSFRTWSQEHAKAVSERTRADLELIYLERWAARPFQALLHTIDRVTAELRVTVDGFSMHTFVIASEHAAQVFTKAGEQLDALHRQISTMAADESKSADIVKRARRVLSASQTVIEMSGCDGATLTGWQLERLSERDRQCHAPWSDAKLERLRHELFIEALELHKSFIAANAQALLKNLGLWVDVLQGSVAPHNVVAGMEHLWESFFLCVPVVSTTFHALPSVFRGLNQESLGWLLIDEAGQATPQAAVGAIWRAQKTLVVGDPLQLEPVFTVPARVVDALEDRLRVDAAYNPRAASAQVLADRANHYGTTIREHWVGCPLRVHRRCNNPMFSVANAISYAGMMVYGTPKTSHESAWLGESCWVDVPSQRGAGHWIPQQGQVAVALLERLLALEEIDGRLFDDQGRARVFLIAPFKDVAEQASSALRTLRLPHVEDICGTIHTFQGKEADVVILLLGGDLASPGAITKYAAGKPNLLNVALTRAKQRIYVVGQYDQWSEHPFFNQLAPLLKRVSLTQILPEGPDGARAQAPSTL